ncbi:MAG: LPS export ABC transporter periplasmic protein LptC [Alphaproteobacteria bacterium]|nr:LPS export ABC transporter periplasmic protein LptC [Alphaproteobacteria bacterium]
MAAGATLHHRHPVVAPKTPRHIGPPRRASRWYSRFVLGLKIVLPLGAVALIGLIFSFREQAPSRRNQTADIQREVLANSQMVNPRFRGIDDQGQPFSLSADFAIPSTRNPNVTDLVQPKGDITRNDGSWVALSAERGAYDRRDRVLDLGGHVSIFHDQGYEMVTSQMRVDMPSGVAVGNEPVFGQGPDTEFQGAGFRLEERGARVVLTGDSRVVIFGSMADGMVGLPDITPSAPQRRSEETR